MLALCSFINSTFNSLLEPYGYSAALSPLNLVPISKYHEVRGLLHAALKNTFPSDVEPSRMTSSTALDSLYFSYRVPQIELNIVLRTFQAFTPLTPSAT